MNQTVTEAGVEPLARTAGVGRILILGHSGFIGSYLDRTYQRKLPGVEIVGLSAPEFDLTREQDAEKLADYLDPQTVVVFLAGVKRQLGDDLNAFTMNIRMAVNFCRVLERHPVKRLVFFSSAAVYGEENQNTRIIEETPVHPTSFYGAAKYAAECLLEKVIRSQGQGSLLILRPPLIYGPGDASNGYGPSGFVKAALDGETITVWGDGSERREFIFVGDVAEIVFALSLGTYNGVLNPASGQSSTYTDIVNILSRTLGRQVQTTSRLRSKNKVDHGYSNATFMKLLPDFAFTPLEEGIRRTIDSKGSR